MSSKREPFDLGYAGIRRRYPPGLAGALDAHMAWCRTAGRQTAQQRREHEAQSWER